MYRHTRAHGLIVMLITQNILSGSTPDPAWRAHDTPTNIYRSQAKLDVFTCLRGAPILEPWLKQ